jgi:hypothetical protein
MRRLDPRSHTDLDQWNTPSYIPELKGQIVESITNKLNANMAESKALQAEMDALQGRLVSLRSEWFGLASQLPGLPVEARRILSSAV